MSNRAILVIIDGWGYNEKNTLNIKDPVQEVKTDEIDYLARTYPSFLISASGLSVGLPDGMIGNSEVGHTTIGIGRVCKQDLLNIDDMIRNGNMSKRIAALDFDETKRIHLIGLLSDGGAHASIFHLVSVITCLVQIGLQINLHLITDGRDTAPCDFLRLYELLIDNILPFVRDGNVHIASVCGRNFAMDRDGNMKNTKLYFNMLYRGIFNSNVNIDGKESNFELDVGVIDLPKYIRCCYELVEDQYIPPLKLYDCNNIQLGDNVLFFNFRSDRMRQLVQMFIDNGFKQLYSLTSYSDSFKHLVTSIYERDVVNQWLTKILLEHNKKIARIAETNKFAHVTYFLDGGNCIKDKNDHKYLIQSPKVDNFRETPAMSTKECVDKAIECMADGYDFICINIAAPDLIGHTGCMESARIAVKSTNDAIGRIYQGSVSNHYLLVVTADHGNIEVMGNDGEIVTSHTNNRVPLLFCHPALKFPGVDYTITREPKASLFADSDYGLQNIAPTLLKYFGIAKPGEMSGEPIDISGLYKTTDETKIL